MLNEIPNFTAVSRQPLEMRLRARVERAHGAHARGDSRTRCGSSVNSRGSVLCSTHLSVRRDVARLDAVAVRAADLERVLLQERGDLLDDVLDGGDALRSAEAAEGRVRRHVRAADRAADLDVREEVRVVRVRHGPRHHRGREIGVRAAVGVEIDLRAP